MSGQHTKKGQHPIPDFPPYDVWQPHVHGAPTTEDTSHGDTDTKKADKKGTENVLAAASRSRFRVNMLHEEYNR